jgi:hypothetical protein
MARKKPRPLKALEQEKLGDLIARNAKVLKVLDEHSVVFCAGCYLTLMSSPERAAVYHAVPNPKKFLRDLEKALR